MPAWKPEQEMNRDTTDLVSGRGYGFYYRSDLFTPRQLTALTTFSDGVHEARELATADALAAGLSDDDVPDGSVSLRESGRGARAYGEAVSVYLAFAVDKGANIWSTIASWMSDRGAFRETFARQAIPMVWDYAEANPFSNSGGCIELFLRRIVQSIECLPAADYASAEQKDALFVHSLSEPLLSTDPPYYDNIGYADLSDFFYVWMRKSLHDIYPQIFSTMLVPKESELIASKYRHNNMEEAKSFFESGMFHTFTNVRRTDLQDYPLTVYCAFKQQDAGFLSENTDDAGVSTGWDTMLTSLITTGFSILGTWPVRTEGS